MSAEIASLDRVRAGVAHIRTGGGTPTADRVIAYLGGGSKATVLRHLKTLREGDAPEELVPPAVMELARSALAQIYSAGAKAEAEKSAAGLIRLTTAIEELEAQVDELDLENTAMRAQLEALQLEQRASSTLANELQASLAQSARELQASRNELVLERGASAEKLDTLMARMEESVAAITRSTAAQKDMRGRQSSA